MRKKRIGIGILLAISMFILFLVGWRLCLSQQNAVYRLTNQAVWHKETYWLPPSLKEQAVYRLSENWWNETASIRLLALEERDAKTERFLSAMHTGKDASLEALIGRALQTVGLSARAIDLPDTYRWTMYEQGESLLLLLYLSDTQLYLFEICAT